MSDVRFPTVLFDLDGTLIDSGAMILSSFRHATRTVLGRTIPDDVLVAACGGATIHDQMRAFADEDLVEELVRVYREHNEPLHADLRAFDGLDGVLARLARERRKLGVVTSKRRKTVALAFAVLPIEGYFDAIVTSDDVERHKPDPEPVLVALERLGSKPDEAAFVGDSPFDVAAGKAAGCFAVAVSWGRIHPEERLRQAGADVVVQTPAELADVL